MAKKNKKNKDTDKKGFFSRFGLPLILIGILSLVALSFASLALLKRAARTDAPPPVVQTTISGSLDGSDIDGQRFPAPPKPMAPSNTAEGTISAPPAAGAGDASPQNWPPAPGGQDGSSGAAPEASTQGWPPPKPGVTAPEKPGATAVAGSPTAAPPVNPVSPTSIPGTTPVSLNQGRPPQANAGPAAQSPPPTQPGTAPPQAAGTPAEAPRESWPPKPPPPKSPVEQMAAEGSGIPKPRWQTLNQDWAKVKVEEAAPEGLDSSGAAWKQIDVGQTDDVQTQETATKPEPAKPQAKAEKTTVTPTRVVPGVTKPGVRTSSTKSRRSRSKAPVNRNTPSLAIINESGYPDQARVYRDVLAAMGYRISLFQDRPSQPGPTRIYYRSGYKSKADNLAKRIPGKKTLSPMNAKSNHDIIIHVRD